METYLYKANTKCLRKVFKSNANSLILYNIYYIVCIIIFHILLNQMNLVKIKSSIHKYINKRKKKRNDKLKKQNFDIKCVNMISYSIKFLMSN